MKKYIVAALLMLGLASVLLYAGCGATNSDTTTTTASGGSTTTLPSGPNVISGTVSWTGATASPSVCDIMVFTSPNLSGSNYTTSVSVGTGRTSVAYNTSGLPNGTFYVVAVIYKGVTTSPGGPRVGDQAGEYSDGLVPSGMAAYFNPTGAGPVAINVTGSGATGKDFSLSATCTNPIPSSSTTTTTSVTTTTVPTGPNMISGTASWTDATASPSVFDILAFTTPDLSNNPIATSINVSAGQTSVAYSTSGLPNGSYYLIGVIYKGVTTSPGKPRVGDQVGEYSDGLVPASQAAYFNPTGAGPVVVNVTGSGANGKNFSLNSTCTAPLP